MLKKKPKVAVPVFIRLCSAIRILGESENIIAQIKLNPHLVIKDGSSLEFFCPGGQTIELLDVAGQVYFRRTTPGWVGADTLTLYFNLSVGN